MSTRLRDLLLASRYRSSLVVISVLVLAAAVPTALRSETDQHVASESAALPGFEVASINLNRRGDRTSSLTAPGGRYVAENMSLRRLIREAYQVQDFQITGGPSWRDSDHYDVSATALGNPRPDRVRLMLRRLLAERFMLSLHTETKELPLYSLIMARKNGAIGPRLHASAMNCDADAAVAQRGVPAPGSGCGLGGGPGRLSGRGVTMDLLATTLAGPVGRFVRNRTGLSGAFDLDLEYTPEAQWGGTGDLTNNSPSDSYPAVFTAVQEQLGLKLQAERGPVTVLVIARAERPTEK